MEERLRLLIVEDSVEDVDLLHYQLKKEAVQYTSLVVETKEEYEATLKNFRPDVVISDHSLPQFDSLAALRIFHSYKKIYHPSAVFILVTGTVSEEFAVQIMKSGADDYILKDRLKRLPTAVLNSVEKNRLVVRQRKMEEEKLHLLDILQKSLHEIYVFDPHTLLFEYVNEEALKNLGYSQDEVLRMTPSDLLQDYSLEELPKMIASVEKSRKGRIYESMNKRKDGSRYPVQIHLQIIQQGEQKKILANVLDITENKETKRQKELGIFIQNCFDEDRKFSTSLELIMERLCIIYRIPAAEIWIKDFENCDAKRYAQWNEKNLKPGGDIRHFAESAFRSGKTTTWENVDQLQDNRKDVKMGALALPVKSGKKMMAVLIIYSTDGIQKKHSPFKIDDEIIAKLAANIKRKKTEEELQKIFQFSPDVLAIVGKDGYFKKINPTLQRILGYSDEDLLSRPISDFIHEEDRYTLEDWQNRSLQDDEVGFYENRFYTANGSYRWFSWSVSPLNEELDFVVGKDMTKSKEQVRSIERQNKRLSEIAWEQSHIVRSPLTRLLACVEYLEEEEAKSQEVLRSIKSSAYELDKILKTIVNKTEHETK